MVLVGRSFFSAAGALVAGLDEKKRKEGEREMQGKKRGETSQMNLLCTSFRPVGIFWVVYCIY